MKVFVSYRRADTVQIAGRICDRLVAAYGRDKVFKDVDSIALGADFRAAIEESVSRCDAMIVLIGPHWLDATNEHGRRLDDPADFVRLEVEGAIAKQIRIIPLLVEEASMPAEAQLPGSLAQLAFRNGTVVRPDPDFHRDMERVIQAIGPSVEPVAQQARSHSDENWHPVVESGFQLRILSGPMTSQVFPLNRARFIVGRGQGCDIVLLHERACSRIGFALEWDWEKREFSVRSMSQLPVLVNERVASGNQVCLAPGDCIHLGTTVLRYEQAEPGSAAELGRDDS